jgi:serine/threonine protein kinase
MWYEVAMQQAGFLVDPAIVGQVIAGKFRVDRVLAQGAMGIVVAATHLQLDQIVAIKLPHREICSDSEGLDRFKREARAAAQMRSEYVARVLDAGATEDGSPYLVMEYLEGQSLDRRLARQVRLDVASAAEYAIQVCEGLAEAHARGIVHRDVKPENLFLVERAPGWHAIKLLDFGISKASLAGAATFEAGTIMGTPCYMSPEQLRATDTVDHRTDLWSLGVTLYELVTGRCPFDREQPLADLFVSILTKPIPNLRRGRPEIPAALAAVVARCMERDVNARFQTAAEVARALVPFAPPRARQTAERAESMPAILRGMRAWIERCPRVDDAASAEGTSPASPERGRNDERTSPERGRNSPDDRQQWAPGEAPFVAMPETAAEPRTAPPTGFDVAVRARGSTTLGLQLARAAAGGMVVFLAVVLAVRLYTSRAPLQDMATRVAPALREALVPREMEPTSAVVVRAPASSATIGAIDRTSGGRGDGTLTTPPSADVPPAPPERGRTSVVNSDDSRSKDARRSSPQPPVTRPPARRAAASASHVGATDRSTLESASTLEIDPRGGRATVHPIDSNSPYPAP